MKDHSKMELLGKWLDEKMLPYILCGEAEKSSFYINSSKRVSIVDNQFDGRHFIEVCYGRDYVHGDYEVLLFSLDGSSKDYVFKDIDEVYKVLNSFIENGLMFKEDEICIVNSYVRDYNFDDNLELRNFMKQVKRVRTIYRGG